MKFRKKPVIIEAEEYKTEGDLPFVEWELPFEGECPWVKDATLGLYIKTLEGNMYPSNGDFIIKGVQGEFYPCKPDIFHETYEKVEE